MLFSIVTPLYNPKKEFLQRAIESVQFQDFKDWEWILVDDGSCERDGIEMLEITSEFSNKIHLYYNERNQNISFSTNKAISNASGEWIIFFDQDDLLHKSALSIIASKLKTKRRLKVIYTDEDKVDEFDQHFDPYFKPDWNPALLTSQNYFCHLLAAEKMHIEKCGSLRIGYEGAQDWDLCLRLTKI